MAPPRKCTVPNCRAEDSRRFRIPVKDEAAKNVWLQRIASESLQKYSDGELSNRVFLCGGHFRKECLGKILSRGSLPTINMPGFHEESTLQNSFIQRCEVEVTIPIDQRPAMNAQSFICETASDLAYEPIQKEFKGKIIMHEDKDDNFLDQPNTTTTLQFRNDTLELVCRTCLKDCTTYFDIFNSKKNNMFVADMLVNCTSLEVQKGDGFPVNICNDCMEKLTTAFDFKIMVIESSTKLHELHQNVEMENKAGLYNNYIENIPIEQEALIKIEQTIITDLHCNNEDPQGNQANKGELDVQVKLECKSLEGNAGFLDVFASQNPENSSETGNYGEVKQIIPVADVHHESEGALGNQASEGAMDIKRQIKFESLDENGDVSDDSAEASSNFEYPSKTRCGKKIRSKPAVKVIKQRSNDEKHAELLNNPDFKRIMSSGLTESQKKRNTVFCTECNKTYSYHYYIKRHAYIHTGKAPYKCDKCEKCYGEKYMLKEHMRSHFQVRDYACDECGKTFILKHHLKNHKAELHSEERPYKCKVCDKYFKRSSNLTQHAFTHKKNKKCLCDICGKGFVNITRLKEHKKNHLTNKNFACTKCGSAFPHESSLEWHLKMHFSENRCIFPETWQIESSLENRADEMAKDVKAQLEFESPDKAGKVSNFSAGASLSREDRVKTDEYEKKVQSPRATKLKKKMKNSDEKHAQLLGNPDYIRIINSDLTPDQRNRETVFCIECNKTFNYRYYIAMHAYIHTGRVPYKCDKCEKCYPKEYMLRRHIRSHLQEGEQQLTRHEIETHSEETPYKCNVCDRSFKCSSSLTSHSFTHMKDKQYICKICGKAFVNKSRLNVHKKRHTTERKFVCTTCGKVYADKDVFSYHLRTHLGQKPYTCKYCDKCFFHERALRKHTRGHTVKLFKCKICDKSFKSPYKLQQHMHTHTVHTDETVSMDAVCS